MGKLQSKLRKRSERYRAGRESGEPVAPQVVQYEPAHNDAVNCVISLTSELCVSGGNDQAVVVYDWKSGTRCQTFYGHSREVTKVTSLNGSTWLFSASRDKCALMWQMGDDAEPVQEFFGHELVVNGLAVSPDGRKLCTGSRDNSMCLWDIESGDCLQKSTISRNLVTHACWVPGSTTIVQTSEDKTVRVWDSRTWQVTHTFPTKRQIQTHCDISSDCYHVLSSSNGVSGQGCEATLWDLRQPGCKVVEYRGHQQSTACSVFLPRGPDCGAMVASSSHDCSVKLWDMNSGACLYTLTLDGAGPLLSLAPSDPSNLLCASFNMGLHHLQISQMPSLHMKVLSRF